MGDRILSTSLSTFTETRVDLGPVAQGPVVHIQLPSSGTFSRASRPQRRILSSTAACLSEDTYTRSCLASASSIYFSKSRKYPRSFLWRVLDNSKVLELRSVDLSKHDRESREATIVIQLGFPSAIRHGCVALADDGHDVLYVFVITKSNELFYLAIRTQYFCDMVASEEGLEQWCSSYSPPTLRPCNPIRLVAGSPDQLVVTLDDGGILKLNRHQIQPPNGPVWKDVACHGGGGILTSSLRGLIRWQGANSISYDGMILDSSTAIAAEFAPSRTHLITVCANHTIKIWNVLHGKVVFSMDLLGQQREPQDVARVLMDAGNPDILRVIEADGTIEGDDYYVVTYSPHDDGQFKIWAIRDADQGSLGVRLLHSDAILRPPEPESKLEGRAIWKLADFKVAQGSGEGGVEFWVVMRSSRRYKIYTKRFGFADLSAEWNNDWRSIIAGGLDQQPPQLLSSEPGDVSEWWLRYLLYPGRYSNEILETALSTYRTTRKVKKTMEGEAGFGDRMSLVVFDQVYAQEVKPDADSGTVFEQYRDSLHREWSLLYQMVQDLERLSWQALSLSYDDQSSMPWCLFTGGYAAIRDCSRLELIANNAPVVLQVSDDVFEIPSIEDDPTQQPKLPHELAVLTEAAADFRASLNPSFRHLCRALLSNELWQEPLNSVAKRIEDYYDRCGFAEEITDPAIARLREALAPIGDVEGLTTDHFLAVIEEIPHVMETRSNLVFSRFGRKLLVKGAQAMIELHARILTDLLVLIVFTDIEVDKEILPKSMLDTSVVFLALIEQLKRYDLMDWLAKHVWHKPTRSHAEQGEETESDSRQEAGLTIMETLFAAAVKPQSLSGQSQSASLTNSIQDLLVFITGGNNLVTLDDAIVHVQCNLLRNDELDLASDFLSLQPSTPWAMYIRGRFYLARGEPTDAAGFFQKAAYKMASKTATDYRSAASDFLSSTEVGHFGQGLPSYYSHVQQLFSSASYHSYAVHFAQLALQFTTQSSSLEPPTQLLNSLYTSALEVSDIETAFTALTRLPQYDQKRALPALIKALLTLPNGAKQLLELPWPAHIYPAIDAYLANDKPSQLKPSERSPVTPEQQRKLLAAWRLKHGDFRGAAAALYSQMQSTVKKKGPQRSGTMAKFRLTGDDAEEVGSRRVDESYLTVINLLACIGGEDADTHDKRSEAWLLSAADGGKRRVVTIDDVRKGWQKELDRRSVIESGRWGFGLGHGDEMELG